MLDFKSRLKYDSKSIYKHLHFDAKPGNRHNCVITKDIKSGRLMNNSTSMGDSLDP